MTLIPQGNRVLIRPDADNTKSTIFIPEAFRRAADRGTVVSVGEGKRHFDGKIYPLRAKPGDRVLFSLTQIVRLEENGEKLAVMDEDAILVFLKLDESDKDLTQSTWPGKY